MVVVGVATAVITEQAKFGTRASFPAFLAITFGDMLLFGGLIAAGIALRSRRPAHRRLMLIATLALTDAGFGRWFSPLIGPIFGRPFFSMPNFEAGFWPFVGTQMLPADTLILAVGAFDPVKHRRLEPAYVAGVVWCVGIQSIAGWLFFQPARRAFAARLIGH